MRFDSTTTSQDRTSARHGGRRRLTRLALGLSGDTRAGWTGHGVLMLVETSGSAAAIGGSAVPAELVADLDPPRGQLPSLAFSAAIDRSVSTLSLMTSPSPFLTARNRTAHTTTAWHCFMATAPKWCGVSTGQRLALTPSTVALLMSGSFVHKSIVAGCRHFSSRLPSGLHEEGRHAK
jgi:hypothetical protein